MAGKTERRICALCGILFALLTPPDVDEPERDKLCPNCLRLPAPPAARTRRPDRRLPLAVPLHHFCLAMIWSLILS